MLNQRRKRMKEDDLRDKLAEKISKITESGTLKNSEQIIADYILSPECLSMLAERYEALSTAGILKVRT